MNDEIIMCSEGVEVLYKGEEPVGSIYYKKTGSTMELRYILNTPAPIRYLGLPMQLGGDAKCTE